VAARGSRQQGESVRPQAASDDIRTLTTPCGTVELYAHDPAFTVAVAGRYAIQIIKQVGNWISVRAVRRAFADLASRYDKFGYVCVMETDCTLLIPADVREAYTALIKRNSPRFSGAAVVYEKTGFQATAVRSLVTAFNVASRASHPNHVFADLREGMYWIGKLTPPEPTPAALVQIVQLLRALPDHER
jgi:hypothetical protein